VAVRAFVRYEVFMTMWTTSSRRRVALLPALALLILLAGMQAPRAQSILDDRPYDAQLLRLSEILGAIHYLRELCGAEEGQLWRNQMKEILRSEGSTAIRRAKLVKSFNKGYRGYRRTYRSCNKSAKVAIARFMEEGSDLAGLLVKQN
jgi:uncharacterized protein (TIGR02301 family)